MRSKFLITILFILFSFYSSVKVESIYAQKTFFKSINISDIDGKPLIFTEKKVNAYVFVFISSECPVSNKYIPKLNNLFSEFKKKGIKFIAVNASPENSIQDIRRHALEYKVKLSVVHDVDQKVMSKLKATTTSEVVALSSAGRLFYRGAIDDQFSVGNSKLKARYHYLRDAIYKFLDNGKISSNTPASGCIISKRRAL